MDQRKLDKFYTNPEWACHCTNTLLNLITPEQRQVIIEPAAGAGAFVDALNNTANNGRTIAFDIAPDRMDIFRIDFLNHNPNTSPEHTTFLGNPPFGFAANKAIKFFNHAAKLGNVIAFIVPLTFRKKSVQDRLNPRFELIYDEPCPKNSFTLEGEEYDVPCCFQIWVKSDRIRNTKKTKNPGIKWLSKTEAMKTSGAFAIRRVGSRAGKIIEGDLSTLSESTHYFLTAPGALCGMIKESDLENCQELENTVAAKSLSKQELYNILNYAKQ